MRQVEERYISLLTDFGFKRIFGTAINKDLLICFLNSLFDGKQVVKDVSYLNPEHVGVMAASRLGGRAQLPGLARALNPGGGASHVVLRRIGQNLQLLDDVHRATPSNRQTSSRR